MPTARDRPPEEAAEDTSFARGLRVLLTIADRGDIRADELSTLLDTPISTVYRYLRTLTEFGFAERRDGGYVLGPRLNIEATTTVSGEDLIRAADPVLQMLVEETGETAMVSRRVGLQAVCLHQIESRHPLRISIEAGSAAPLDVGAIAKVLLAFSPDDVATAVLGPGGLTDRADLREIVESGVARTEHELVSDSVMMAVPILRDDGIIAALGVIGPEVRCGLRWRNRVARLLPQAARTVLGSLNATQRPESP